jgi:hypothetical protein
MNKTWRKNVSRRSVRRSQTGAGSGMGSGYGMGKFMTMIPPGDYLGLLR